MKKPLLSFALVLLVPSFAIAHVSVRPRESKPGAEERYTVRVPTEGTVATTHVMLEIPSDLEVIEVLPADGATYETTKQGARISSITWKKDIPPKSAAEFVLRARNPATGEIVWKAHQHFSDGTVADWAGPAGDRRPAAVTKLVSQQAAATGTQNARDAAAAVEAWLKGYDAAFNAKDLDRLATFYHPDVTIYEGGGVDRGWAAYRDGHLGPELKGFENLQFGHSDRQIHMLGDRSAYVVSTYFLKAKMGERVVDSGGLETLVLMRGDDGSWKIRHSHTSARPRRPAGGGQSN